MDSQYQSLPFSSSERKHMYGDHVHLLSDPYCISLLAKLCHENCQQPVFNQYIRQLYENIGTQVANHFFVKKTIQTPTRMSQFHPEGVFEGEVLDPQQKIVIVSVARAGIIPSNALFEMYANVISSDNIRVDHVYINRTVGKNGEVTGAHLSGSKIGGSIEGAIVLVPDPMGATASTILQVLEHYREFVPGKAKAWISLQLILTPEFIRNLHAIQSDVSIFSYRLDRAFSSAKALSQIPGKLWAEEKGLNANDYIVPGGGGFGELMSHSWV